jgi:hypothetical protein
MLTIVTFNASSMVITILFTSPEEHITRITCIPIFAFTEAGSLTKTVARTLFWAGFQHTRGTCETLRTFASTIIATHTMPTAFIRAFFLAVITTKSFVTFNTFRQTFWRHPTDTTPVTITSLLAQTTSETRITLTFCCEARVIDDTMTMFATIMTTCSLLTSFTFESWSAHASKFRFVAHTMTTAIFQAFSVLTIFASMILIAHAFAVHTCPGFAAL